MAEHYFTVYVYHAGSSVPVREYSGVSASSGAGAIDRVVDMFHVNKSDCKYKKER